MERMTFTSRFVSRLGGVLPVILICLIIPGSALGTDKLLVKNGGGTTTFKVEDTGNITSSGSLLANGAEAVGASPMVLGQVMGNGGIVLTNKAASNPKQAAFGWDPTHTWVEILAVHQSVGYKDIILNPYGGNIGIGTTSPSYPLQMGSGAYCSTGGVWTNASSREYKKDIKELTGDEAMGALRQLSPVKFSYKVDSEERHVGFIAEDAPELVATKDKKGMSPMDVVAVLTKVVQEQQKTIAELSKKMDDLERQLKLERNPTLARAGHSR